MSLALITQPAFLRSRFAYTRQGLLGQWPAGARRTVIETEARSAAAPLLDINHLVDRASTRLRPIEFPQIPVVAPKADVVISESERVVDQSPIIAAPKPVRSINRAAHVPIWKSATKSILTIIMIVTIGLSSAILLPELYFTVFSQQNAVQEVAEHATQAKQAKPVEEQPYMPAFNPDLPTGTWINIPSIGVNSEVRATANPDEALDLGVWMVPDFGRPGDYTQPTIMAAHRFGWDWWWQSEYWKLNSFYLLTETQPGDRIEIIHDQRKWVYEIYAGEEGELISDYDADLILYTCKYLQSPIRYFRYADVVKE